MCKKDIAKMIKRILRLFPGTLSMYHHSEIFEKQELSIILHLGPGPDLLAQHFQISFFCDQEETARGQAN